MAVVSLDIEAFLARRLAVPVFDGFGQVVLAIAAIGPSVTLTLDPAGLPARKLQAQARALSQRLGAPAALTGA